MVGPSELGLVMRPGQMIRRPKKKPADEIEAVPDGTTLAVQTTVFVKGLMVEAECGVYAHEKGNRRPLIIDVDVMIDANVRSTSDQLGETVDYDTLVAHIRRACSGSHVQLIETLAEMMAHNILSDARILEVRLRVEKPGAVPGAVCSGVEIVRARAKAGTSAPSLA
jgi:7,8-dihydroneopterin aldolase/epimerase/oxygenase